MNENRFVFVACCYNMSRTIEQTLKSIVSQSYSRWKIVVTDDVSDEIDFEETLDVVGRVKEFLGPDSYKFVFRKNETKKWETHNVLSMIKDECVDDDIVCRIDCDDWLTDLDILNIIDRRYRERRVQALWTGHRWNFTDMNISAPMEPCSDVYDHPWVSSHLKTFRKSLLNEVPVENFQNSSGEFIRRAGDQCVYLPALHNSRGNWWFEPRVAYHYTIDEKGGAVYQTDDAKFQKLEAEFIRDRGYVNSGDSWEQFV